MKIFRPKIQEFGKGGHGEVYMKPLVVVGDCDGGGGGGGWKYWRMGRSIDDHAMHEGRTIHNVSNAHLQRCKSSSALDTDDFTRAFHRRYLK